MGNSQHPQRACLYLIDDLSRIKDRRINVVAKQHGLHLVGLARRDVFDVGFLKRGRFQQKIDGKRIHADRVCASPTQLARVGFNPSSEITE